MVSTIERLTMPRGLSSAYSHLHTTSVSAGVGAIIQWVPSEFERLQLAKRVRGHLVMYFENCLLEDSSGSALNVGVVCCIVVHHRFDAWTLSATEGVWPEGVDGRMLYQLRHYKCGSCLLGPVLLLLVGDTLLLIELRVLVIQVQQLLSIRSMNGVVCNLGGALRVDADVEASSKELAGLRPF